MFAVGNTPADANWLDNRLEIDFTFADMLNFGNDPYRVHLGTTSPDYAIQEERYKIWAITELKLDL